MEYKKYTELEEKQWSRKSILDYIKGIMENRKYNDLVK